MSISIMGLPAKRRKYEASFKLKVIEVCKESNNYGVAIKIRYGRECDEIIEKE